MSSGINAIPMQGGREGIWSPQALAGWDILVSSPPPPKIYNIIVAFIPSHQLLTQVCITAAAAGIYI